MKDKTKIIGILNLTDDSFSDGGKYLDENNAITHIKKILKEGCEIIDIGAESTRLGFHDISTDMQLKKMLPILSEIKKINQDIKISIDTRSSQVAEEALKEGASIVNDVSSGTYDQDMFDIVSKYNAEIILTHMPKEYLEQKNIKSNNIIKDISNYFDEIIKIAIAKGIKKENIIIDPGISFGKSGTDNIEILKNVEYFVEKFERVCLGVSNKRFSSKIFKDIKDDDLKIISLTISTYAAFKNVEFLRVHDIDANQDAVDVVWKTINSL